MAEAAVDSLLVVPVEIDDIQTNLDALATANPAAASKINDAIDKLDTAQEELDKMPPDNEAAAGNIEGAVGELEATIQDGDLSAGDGIPHINQILDIVRTLATDAIQAAIDGGGDPDKIEEAQDKLADGDTLRGMGLGNFKDASAAYKDAISKAEGAGGSPLSPASVPLRSRGGPAHRGRGR